jgi:hypothetical protein
VVRVVAILFHLFPALLLVVHALLASPPEEDGAEYEQGNGNNGDDDSNGCLAAGAQSAGTIPLGSLEASRVSAGWAAYGLASAVGGL